MKYVKINDRSISELARSISAKDEAHVSWDFDTHFHDGGDLTVQYLLVLDAINFCFWPSEGKWEYDPLARALKGTLLKDRDAFSAESLATLQEDRLLLWLGGTPLPRMDERVRLLREVGQGLAEGHGGLAANMVRSAGGSAARLVGLVLAAFPGFRDEAVHAGQRVHFYKRAQIFVGDVWGAFNGQGLGSFRDMDQLTMFADYRVPQILQAYGVLEYEAGLADRIARMEVVAAGSDEELEIRAATVEAVERLRAALAAEGHPLLSIQVDWRLWQEGERRAAGEEGFPAHHRTVTTFY